MNKRAQNIILIPISLIAILLIGSWSGVFAKMQMLRGPEAQIPSTLANGEPIITTDTGRFFVGTSTASSRQMVEFLKRARFLQHSTSMTDQLSSKLGTATHLTIVTTPHVTTAEKTLWNNKMDDTTHDGLTVTPHVTAAEKATWNAKQSPFANNTTLARIGAGPTYRGVDIVLKDANQWVLTDTATGVKYRLIVENGLLNLIEQ